MSATEPLPNNAEPSRGSTDAPTTLGETTEDIIALGENAEFWAEYNTARRARRLAKEREKGRVSSSEAEVHHGLLAKLTGKRASSAHEEPEVYQRNTAPVSVEEQEAASATLDEQAAFWAQWAASEGGTSAAPKKSPSPAPQIENRSAAPPPSAHATPPSVLLPRESLDAIQDATPEAGPKTSSPSPTSTSQETTIEGFNAHESFWEEWKENRRADHSNSKKEALAQDSHRRWRLVLAIGAVVAFFLALGAIMSHEDAVQAKNLSTHITHAESAGTHAVGQH